MWVPVFTVMKPVLSPSTALAFFVTASIWRSTLAPAGELSLKSLTTLIVAVFRLLVIVQVIASPLATTIPPRVVPSPAVTGVVSELIDEV